MVEVIAEDWLDARERDLRALRLLGATVPMILHGTSLGLASVYPVDERRLTKIARLIDAAQPIAWSEHLAFVRAGGLEIGHLAAPPRTRATIDGLMANIARAKQIVGTAPILENIATLIDPPLSEMSELDFVCEAIAACDVPLLLDLHNLHANATNFGWSASEFLAGIDELPIAYVHLAGGRVVRGGRILDDHLHATPDPVFALLRELASRRAEPLTVVLERDGRYPHFDELLAELDRARASVVVIPSVVEGPGRGSARAPSAHPGPSTTLGMTEETLARLYVDPKFPRPFPREPALRHRSRRPRARRRKLRAEARAMITALLAAPIPGLIIYLLGQRMLRKADDPAFTEKFWRLRIRISKIVMLSMLALAALAWRWTPVTLPLFALCVWLGSFPLRKAVFAEEWTLGEYLRSRVPAHPRRDALLDRAALRAGARRHRRHEQLRLGRRGDADLGVRVPRADAVGIRSGPDDRSRLLSRLNAIVAKSRARTPEILEIGTPKAHFPNAFASPHPRTAARPHEPHAAAASRWR